MKPPHIKAQRKKEFRKNSKRQRELFDQKQKLGYIKLEKPIKHGWFKELVLTTNVERFKQSDAIKEVHQKIRTSYWGATKEKAQQAWDKDRSRYMLTKDKPTLSRKSFNKLSEKGKDLCVAFLHKGERARRYKVRFYVNFPPGSFVLRFRRAYITHRRRIDPQIESELDYLESQLMKPGFYEITLGGIWNRWNRMEKSKNQKTETHRMKEYLSQFRNKVISEELKEEILWEIN
jgi:hypothetical protein